MRVLELSLSIRMGDTLCRALLFPSLPYPHSQSSTCRPFQPSLHPGPANRSGQEAVTVMLSWGHYPCPAVFSVTPKEDHSVSGWLLSWGIWRGEEKKQSWGLRAGLGTTAYVYRISFIYSFALSFSFSSIQQIHIMFLLCARNLYAVDTDKWRWSRKKHCI